MKLTPVFYNNFLFGRLDRKIIMRADLDYRKNGFSESDNVFCTYNLTAVPRPGTRLVMDFGTEATRIIPFVRGQNQQYVLAMQANKQSIYYVDVNGNFVPTLADDVSKYMVPQDLTSNTDQNYVCTGANGNLDYYKIYTRAGYTGTDIKNTTITFPQPIKVFAIEFLQGVCDGITCTLTKSDNTQFTVDATPETTGSTKYVMPSDYDYTDIVSIQMQTYEKFYVRPTINPTRMATIGWRPSVGQWVKSYGGYIQNINIVGTQPGEVAVWNEPIPWNVVNKLDYDQNNSYIFLADHSIQPYYLSISGTFEFFPLGATFPTDYSWETMGYPAHVACGQSRLWFANMEKLATTIIASKIGYEITDFKTFTPTVVDTALSPDSAIRFTPIEMKNRIEWILGGDSVALGSWDGTYKMFYGQNGVISATGAAIKQQNEDAASGVKPAWKDGKMIFTGISRDNLRLMDYNLYVARQDSYDISNLHTEIMSRIVKKTIIKKDAANDLYVLFEDGTAAMCHFLDKEKRGFFPFYVANAKIKDINVVKSDNGDRLYLTCYYNDGTWKLVLMDEITMPLYPAKLGFTDAEYQEEVCEWVRQKCPLDFKVYNEQPLTFLPEAPLYVSQIQKFDPQGISGIIDQYGPYVVFLNNPVNGQTWDSLVGKTLFFEDTKSYYDFYVKVQKVGDFIFGIPSNPDNPHWNNLVKTEGNYNYAFTATNGYIGIEELDIRYTTDSVHVFSDREYLGELSCLDNDGNQLNRIQLPAPVAKTVYGVQYPIFFDLGNVMTYKGMAKRKVSLVDINSYGSWGLSVGTESTSQLVQLFDPKSIYGLIPKPMQAWTHVKLQDAYATEKTVRIIQTLPYPFEIMGIAMMLEENYSETGI